MTRIALVALAACGSHKPPAVAAERVGAALAAAIAQADRSHEPWRCAAADLPALDAPVIPGWQTAEHGLTHAGEDLVVGIVADAGGAAPKTLAALGRLREKMEAANADAVITLGGMGSDERDVEATLGVLAAPRSDRPARPVIALAGDLEAESAQIAAIAALRAHGAIVVDGRLARWLVAGSATFATLPGAATPPPDGCAWTVADATRIYSELSAKQGLRIAIVAGAPREDRGGIAAGELALVPEPAIDLVVHGPVQPEPSAALKGGRDGARLGVSPGTSDATARLPETRLPSAGVLAIHGTSWTWTPLVDR